MDEAVNVVVTGGTGFFGHNLVRALLEDPRVALVHVVARNPPPTEGKLSSWRTAQASLAKGELEPSREDERVLQSSEPNAVFDNPRVRFFRGDINNESLLREAAEDCYAMFHACGDTRWWNAKNAEQRITNVDGTRTALKVARAVGIKQFVYTSTVDVMGHYDPAIDVYKDVPAAAAGKEGVLDETYPGPPHKYYVTANEIYQSTIPQHYSYAGFGYNYADTKRDAERFVLDEADGYRAGGDTSLRITVIRPGSMLGPWDVTDQYGRLFGELKSHSLAGIPCGGTSICHVEDVAHAHITAAFAPSLAHSVYICAGANVSYEQLFLVMRGMLEAYHDTHTNLATPIGGVCGGHMQIIPRSLLVVYAWLCEQHSNWWSGCEPELNPGMARYMSCHAYYSSERAERELNYPTQTPRRWLEAIAESYHWYRVRGRF